MFKNLSLRVGLRYTRAKRRNHFISFISLVSTIGIALGVMVLITVLSVMNGFDHELRERILGSVPHVSLYSMDKGLQDWQTVRSELMSKPEIISAAPFVQGQGMLTNYGLNHYALLQGIEPKLEDSALNLSEKLLAGSLDSLTPGAYNILLGKKLANYLALNVGDKVTVVIPETTTSLAGVLPRLKRFTLTGIFELGYEYDNNLALMHIADAQKLYKLGSDISGINLRLQDLYAAPRVALDLSQRQHSKYFASDWTVTNGGFFKAVKMEKTLMFVLLLFIVLVATFNILATLVMMVTEKKSDIAILRTMGASPRTIMQIFMIQGSVIGSFGTMLGIILGVLLSLSISDIVTVLERLLHIQFLSADVYYISFLPSKLELMDILIVAGASMLMSFIFTIYPALKAAKMQPAQALRYE